MAVSLVYTKGATPYMDSYAETEKQLAAARTKYLSDQSALRDAYRTQINNEQTGALNKSNAEYDNTAKQNYINYMQAQKKLPSQLNALGIRGGASESSLIRMGSSYGQNVANNESARASALADIREAYAKQLSDYDADYSSRLSDYDQDYYGKLATAKATALQNQITWEREAQQKDLEYFSGVIDGLYKSKDSYKNLIAQLRASNDPNKEYKILLATKAMNNLEDGGSSGGGGGGSSYRSSGGSYSDGGTTTTSSSKTSTKKNNKSSSSKTSSGSKKKTVTIKGDTYYVTSKGSYTKNKSRGATR